MKINSLYDMYFANDESDSFAHVGRSKRDGAKVGSGRYPLGSGKEPYQHVNKSKSSCPSIEGYAEEVGADITRWIVDD